MIMRWPTTIMMNKLMMRLLTINEQDDENDGKVEQEKWY